MCTFMEMADGSMAEKRWYSAAMESAVSKTMESRPTAFRRAARIWPDTCRGLLLPPPPYPHMLGPHAMPVAGGVAETVKHMCEEGEHS